MSVKYDISETVACFSICIVAIVVGEQYSIVSCEDNLNSSDLPTVAEIRTVMRFSSLLNVLHVLWCALFLHVSVSM